MSAISISVVVPTFDRPVQLSRCIRALRAQRIPHDRFELIIVNDGGKPLTLEGLRDVIGDLQVRIHNQLNAGPAAGRNAGSAIARGDYLAFIDDDCVPSPEWLSALDSVLEREPDAMIGGRTINALTDNMFSQASQTLVDYVYQYYKETGADRPAFFSSSHMILRADAFRAMRGFDESFRTAEDRELCNRWKLRGGRFHYAPQVVVYHAHELALRSFHRQHFGYGRGALPYWEKTNIRGVRGIRIEPLKFYTRMLWFPFAQKQRHPAVLSALIFLSQISNAGGFAFEGLSRLLSRSSPQVRAGETESA